MSDYVGPQVRRPDGRLAAAELGWEATTSLHDGLSATVAWYLRSAGREGGLVSPSR